MAALREYRTRVLDASSPACRALAPADRVKHELSKSVGCFVAADRLEPVTRSAVDKTVIGFKISANPRNPICTYAEDVKQAWAKEDDNKKKTDIPIDKNFPFKNDRLVADSTCYAVADNVVATCGHCVFNPESSDRQQLYSSFEKGSASPDYVVFNLLSNQCGDDPNHVEVIPPTNVYVVDRVLCGEYSAYQEEDEKDTPNIADWALVRLKPLAQCHFPAPLTILPLAEFSNLLEYKDNAPIWITGYPNGSSEKLSVPPQDPAVRGRLVFDPKEAGLSNLPPPPVSNTTVETNAVDLNPEIPRPVRLLRHNLRTNPANSGSPLLYTISTGVDPRNVVIGTHSSKGHIRNIRRYGFWFDPSDQDQLHILQNVDPNQPKRYARATLPAVWHSLIQRTSTIRIALRVDDFAEVKGSLELFIHVQCANLGVSVSLGVIPMNERVVINRQFDDLTRGLGEGVLPCHIDAVSFKYTPVNANDEKAQVFLKHLGVASEPTRSPKVVSAAAQLITQDGEFEIGASGEVSGPLANDNSNSPGPSSTHTTTSTNSGTDASISTTQWQKPTPSQTTKPAAATIAQTRDAGARDTPPSTTSQWQKQAPSQKPSVVPASPIAQARATAAKDTPSLTNQPSNPSPPPKVTADDLKKPPSYAPPSAPKDSKPQATSSTSDATDSPDPSVAGSSSRRAKRGGGGVIALEKLDPKKIDVNAPDEVKESYESRVVLYMYRFNPEPREYQVLPVGNTRKPTTICVSEQMRREFLQYPPEVYKPHE